MYKNKTALLKQKICLNFSYLNRIFYVLTKAKNPWTIWRLIIKQNTYTKLILQNNLEFTVGGLLDLSIIYEVLFEECYDIDIKSPNTIIDIGAHIGTYSVYCSKKYNKSTIYALEPAESTYQLLIENLKANSCDNVITINKGVWKEIKNKYLFTGVKSGMSTLFKAKSNQLNKGEYSQFITIDQIFKEYNIKKCDLLKIDCEGSEYDILLNTKPELLQKINYIVMEYHDDVPHNNHHKLLKYLHTKGFTIIDVRENILQPIGILKLTNTKFTI